MIPVVPLLVGGWLVWWGCREFKRQAARVPLPPAEPLDLSKLTMRPSPGNEPASGPVFEVTYKVGRATKVERVAAATESDAVAIMVKRRIIPTNVSPLN